jgi:hypothetical protein
MCISESSWALVQDNNRNYTNRIHKSISEKEHLWYQVQVVLTLILLRIFKLRTWEVCSTYNIQVYFIQKLTDIYNSSTFWC